MGKKGNTKSRVQLIEDGRPNSFVVNIDGITEIDIEAEYTRAVSNINANEGKWTKRSGNERNEKINGEDNLWEK
jgi:hypothetical protein